MENSFYNMYVKRCLNKDIKQLKRFSSSWVRAFHRNKMSYEIDWMGIPIIQTPEDIINLQMCIYHVRPNLIIETGVAHGGGLIFYSSMLKLIGGGSVIGVDIEIRPHNRYFIEDHPLSTNIELIEGDSTSKEVIDRIKKGVRPYNKIMVILDSNHTKNHVLKELRLYSKFVNVGSYIVVCDTVTSKLAKSGICDKKYIDNSPKEAVDVFLKENPYFIIDNFYDRLYFGYNIGGFLKRIK